MLEFLFRLFLFGVGCVALADTFVAPVTESVVLDLHTQFTRRALGTNYTLHFGRSRTGSCSVGCGTYRALSDGDELLLTTTRIGRECVKIERHGEEILRDAHWRWWRVLVAVVFFAAAFGKVQWSSSSDSLF
jgi:hypothetical protein